MKSPVTLIQAFFTDVKRLDSTVQGLDRDLITIKRRYEHEGISFLSNTLVKISDALDRGLEDSTFDCPTSFAKKKSSALPKFLWGLLSNVFYDTGDLKPEPCVHSIKLIRELARMFKKFNLDPDAISDLERVTMNDFIKTDENLHLSFDERESHLLKLVSSMVLKRISIDNLFEKPVFKHGPGSTLETSDINVKWDILYKNLSDPHSYLPFGFDTNYFGPESVSRRPSIESKLICVPKTSKSLRTISVETTCNQFIQQQLNDYLRTSIDRCDILSQCLTLKDQRPNQMLALSGSLDRSFATIDLSKASDRLSNELVTIAFEQNNPLFLKWLFRSRAHTISVDKQVYRLNKYAGMGNATTFPVQSVCYALVCIAALHDYDGIKPSYYSCKRYAGRIHVFGDDIIIPTDRYAHVAKWLSAFGLVINGSKSFHKGNFRESCGCDAYNGVDVTPVYIRTLPTKVLHTPSILAATVAASNLFWERGLYSTATLLANLCGKYINLPLVSVNSGVLGLHSRIDAMEAHSWDSKLQCLKTRGYSLKPRYAKSKNIGDGAKLLKCLLSSFLSRSDPKHLDRYVKRFNTRLRSTWVPTYVGY